MLAPADGPAGDSDCETSYLPVVGAMPQGSTRATRRDGRSFDR